MERVGRWRPRGQRVALSYLAADINYALFIKAWPEPEPHPGQLPYLVGGIVARAGHPAAPGPLNGGPQMVEISRDGRRVYFTNSLYGAIDPQFYPDGIEGWMVKLDAAPNGGIAFDPKFFVKWPAPHRPHQVRLEGGDCSTDSFCYPSA